MKTFPVKEKFTHQTHGVLSFPMWGWRFTKRIRRRALHLSRSHARGVILGFVFAWILLFLGVGPALAETEPSKHTADLSIRHLISRVEALRGLTFKRPVIQKELDEVTLSRLLKKAFEERAEELPAVDRILKLLGMLPLDQSLRSLLEPLYKQQVAGVYDPRSRTLYVRSNLVVEGSAETILVHELTHALVDQNFDLKRYIYDPRVVHESERQIARQAVAEGDATLVMLVYQMNQIGMNVTVEDLVQLEPDMMEGMLGMATLLDQGLSGVPPWLVRLFVAPYIDGYRIVVSAYRKGGWKAVNDLYRRPPQTTEHLLHPGRYFDGEPIRTVTFPSDSNDSRVIYEDVFGELSWRLFLQHWLSEDEARKATDGWDGDRCRLIHEANGWYRFEAMTVWDNGDEAGEFAAAVRSAMQRLQKARPKPATEYDVRVEKDRVFIRVRANLATGLRRDRRPTGTGDQVSGLPR